MSKNRTLIPIVFFWFLKLKRKVPRLNTDRLAIKVLSKGVLKRIVTQSSADYISSIIYPVYMYLAQFAYETKIIINER